MESKFCNVCGKIFDNRRPDRILSINLSRSFDITGNNFLTCIIFKMGNKSSLMLQEQDIRDIQAETGCKLDFNVRL